jgi:hypothetical protein
MINSKFFSRRREGLPKHGTSFQGITMQNRNLAEDYIVAMIGVISSEDSINDAINNRNVLKSRVNEKSNLASLSSFFDRRGNISREDAHIYHDKERLDEEIKLYAMPTELSDREKIAFTAVFFEVGSGLIYHTNEYQNTLLETLQVIIARSVAKYLGFSTPEGYEPKPVLLRKLNQCLHHSDEIYNYAEIITNIKIELKRINATLISFRHQAAKRSTFSFYMSIDEKKISYLTEISSALDDFNSSHDFLRLACYMKNFHDTYQRKGLGRFFTYRLRHLMQDLNDVVMENEKHFFESATDDPARVKITLDNFQKYQKATEALLLLVP